MVKISDNELKNLYGNADCREQFEARVLGLLSGFFARFNCNATDVFSSPGRIEICGNHTDHQKGKVLVGTVSCDMLACVSKADTVEVVSEGYAAFGFNPMDTAFNESEARSSLAMTKGVFQGFKNAGYKTGGFRLMMNSTVFNGAGVSSSAAFELLICQILNCYYNDGKIEPFELAKIAKYSENEYFLKPSGLLDQSGIAFGGISKIDFRDLDKPVIERLKGDTLCLEIVITNSGDHSNLTDEYSAIRSEMEEVSAFFGKKVLREVDEGEFYEKLAELKTKVSGRAILRAIHFFDENRRVDDAAAALVGCDKQGFIAAINASGLSSDTYLQNYYATGDRTEGISLSVALSKKLAPASAHRVHGGGFAGTSISFVEPSEKETLVNKLREVFGAKNVFLANVRNSGAKQVELEIE